MRIIPTVSDRDRTERAADGGGEVTRLVDGVGTPASIRALVQQLAGSQKPGDGVPAYTRWVNRSLARYPAAVAYRIGLSPNAVTALSAVLSFAGLAVVAAVPPSPLSGLLAAVLLASGYVLDSADGQLARLSGRGGPAGEWLDHVVDAIRSPAVHVAVLIGFWHSHLDGPILALPLAFALLTTGQFMSQILAEQLSRATEQPPSEKGPRRSWLLLPTDSGVIIWMFLAWGAPAVFPYLYGTVFLVNLLHTATSMRRKYRKLASLPKR